MKFTHRQYAQALYEALQDTNTKNHDSVIENFISILRQKGDLGEYEEIVEVFEAYDKQQRGITDVELLTATPDTKISKSIVDELNSLVGNNIELKHKVDSNLIGGVVIKAGDTLIDGSVKHHLDHLRNTLIQ